nr:uncharacterized protein LOC117852152 [Setaria viridis]
MLNNLKAWWRVTISWVVNCATQWLEIMKIYGLWTCTYGKIEMEENCYGIPIEVEESPFRFAKFLLSGSISEIEMELVYSVSKHVTLFTGDGATSPAAAAASTAGASCSTAPSRARVDDVRAALAPPSGGAIEAVALSEYLAAAVVVFRTAPGAESALRGPARGSCHAVTPLELGAEMPVIRPTDVKIMSDSRIPATGSPECGTPAACTPQPPPEEAAWIEFREPSVPAEADGSALPPRPARHQTISRHDRR